VGPGCQGSPSGPPSGAFNREDRKFAQLAIEEARKSASEADGRSHPKVGAVVVRGNQVIAQAHRGEEPGCHAEYIVLERKLADDSLVDATVYTTLEPCTARNHPKVPCARRIAERKVKRVVIGTLDPNPSITGRGQLMLREANIITDLFPHDLMSQVEELNRDFTRQYRTAAADAPIITAGWEVRYPGGLADVSMLRTKEPALVQRFAIGEDFTLINRSPHPVSISALFLIVYGCTQLAVDPFSLQLPEWPRLLAAFGIRQKPQLLFPLNLAGHSAIEGHILVPIRPDGQGRGVGGDVPAKRQYLFEFEELLTGKKSSVVVSAIGAPDRDNHQCYSGTDLARPGPKQQPFSVD
jgi:pyrimidine deaminase RibD-like protein